MLDEVSTVFNVAAASQVVPLVKRRSKAKKRKQSGELAGLQEIGVYVRVSMDKRKQKNAEGRPMTEEIVSPDTQERLARAYCESQGWNVVVVEPDIDESAFRQHYSKRPGLMRLLDAVKRGQITKIVVFKFNRLSRRLVEFTEILGLVEAAGAGVVSISEQIDTSTPGGRMIRNVMASFAQYQSEELSEQIYETWMTLVKAGKRQPGRPPYGTVNNKGMLEPDPKTHQVLLAMFERFVETRSVLGVVDYLAERRITTPDGASNWGHTVVRGILTNSAYIGQNWFDGEVHEAKWAPIVPVELWAQAQAILDARRTEAPTRVDAHLLRGHAICEDCGRPLWTQYGKRSDGYDRYYGCVDIATGRRSCRTPWPHAAELEELVWSVVYSLCQPHQLERMLRDVQQSAPNENNAQQRAQLLRDQERLRGKVQDLFDLLRDKHITAQQFGEQNRTYGEQIADLRRSLELLDAGRAGQTTIDDVRAAAERIRQAGPLEARRLGLADLGVKVHVSTERTWLEIPCINWSTPLPARRIMDRLYFSAAAQRLDYHGAALTDKQVRFLQRTYGRFDSKKIAVRLGRSMTALRTQVMRLRRSGVTIGASPVR